VAREGIASLIWYMAWVLLFTVVVRGGLQLGVRYMVRCVPDTSEAMKEVERYGWWISLVLGAMIAAAA
jgi:hypothetical protein